MLKEYETQRTEYQALKIEEMVKENVKSKKLRHKTSRKRPNLHKRNRRRNPGLRRRKYLTKQKKTSPTSKQNKTKKPKQEIAI